MPARSRKSSRRKLCARIERIAMRVHVGISSAHFRAKGESMKKLLTNDINTHAKPKLSLALCTVLALTSTALLAQQDKPYDQDKGVPGTETQTQTGKAGQLSRSDEKFMKDACHGGR